MSSVCVVKSSSPYSNGLVLNRDNPFSAVYSPATKKDLRSEVGLCRTLLVTTSYQSAVRARFGSCSAQNSMWWGREGMWASEAVLGLSTPVRCPGPCKEAKGPSGRQRDAQAPHQPRAHPTVKPIPRRRSHIPNAAACGDRGHQKPPHPAT